MSDSTESADTQVYALTSRIKKLEDSSASARITSRASIIAACLAVIGVLATGAVQYFGHKETARANDERNKTDQARVVAEKARVSAEQARTTGEIKRVYADRLDKLDTTSYESKRATIKVIASIYGVAEAVYVESAFRSGATIRALQDLKRELERRGDPVKFPKTKHELALVEQSLESVPRLLFVDSREPENIYCKDTIRISATNVDDIIDLVKDMPVRITAMIGDGPGVGPAQVAKKVKAYSENLVLVVIHAGAFALAANDLEGQSASTKDQEKVGSFLAHIEGQGFAGKVIVYSRGDGMLKYIGEEMAKRRKGPSMVKLIPVELDDNVTKGNDKDWEDRDCFRKESRNAQLIQRAIHLALAYDNLVAKE